MAKLILSMDGLVLKEIPLTKARLTIGRKSHNDIQIDNLAVSGDHAAVVTILSDSFLEDLNSTNGILVNGQPVKKHFLKNGDEIEFSKYKLKYFSDTAAPIQAAEFEKTPLLVPGKPKIEMTSSASASSTSQEAACAAAQSSAVTTNLSASFLAQETVDDALPVAAIRLLSGSSAGRQLELTRPLTSLGKLGIQAAVIAKKPLGYFILKAEGSPPPEVNGKLMREAERLLKEHDVIELAGVKMEFFLKSP
jgi:hypothetical protein